MRIRPDNLQLPTQTPYAIGDRVLPSDPNALTAFFGASRLAAFQRDECLAHNYAKAHRLHRLAAKARHDRRTRDDR
jgi:hypothetical protein